ncbi:nitrite reductase [Magnetofaba australis]|uniref:Putative Cytochrome c bacterial n=1 Tax=Magnetofaba australis IT-1 TaxID=1434232 RepID=A0A1Y2K242_9PROT|nr:nitrite reductase [Magnetofaba australis]OSM01727.1 putative Cytochrome c bacterial [Magnetofaba australis IT-1]
MSAPEGKWHVRNRQKLIWGTLIVALVALIGGKKLYPAFFTSYTGVVNAELTYENSARVADPQFERIADDLTVAANERKIDIKLADEKNAFTKRVKREMFLNLRSNSAERRYPHIGYFRQAGIKQYEGPKTCTQCHETMHVTSTATGETKAVSTLEDIVDTVHFKMQTTDKGFTTWGYDGRQVNSEKTRAIPLGKINRGCGVPGSFSWTGWAVQVKGKPMHDGHEKEVLYSEGCGQCHIGGNYHPATEKMMPVGDVPEEAKQGIDCLICHADRYDMNERYVVKDAHGMRWNQDRSLAAAVTVGMPSQRNCLFCHQHNMGGDTEQVNDTRASLKNLGKVPRILHPGAKRGTSFQPAHDVHSAAGLICTDCHQPEGHKIPRGVKGVDLVANDLPGKVVECENCHTNAPHLESLDRAILNGHVNRLACETCHMTKLRDDNIVLRDWLHPEFIEHEGLNVYYDIYKSGAPGKGFQFLWSNGQGTFLANALGDNPTPGSSYNPLMNQLVKITDPEIIAEVRAKAEELKKKYPEVDVEKYVADATDFLRPLSPEQRAERARVIEEKLRPVMQMGQSRIYPFKMFNAVMYEDMGNQGPFGAMILPFDYPTYYETGNPEASMVAAMQHPIMKRMYEEPFKLYMMDEFMKYFGVGEWNTTFPLTADNKPTQNVQANWMRQMGTLFVNHGIRKDGHKCQSCHTDKGDGIMDFKALGYPPERVEDLQTVLKPNLKRAALKQAGGEGS